jgi:hypothetical protein
MARYAAQTEVSSDRSRSEIERTLRRYGATAFAYGWEGNRAQIGFKLADRQIKFTLPLPDPSSEEFVLTPTGRERSAKAAEDAYEQAVRQRWRALALVIKAKLEAVEAGISTVEREFLDAIMLPGGRLDRAPARRGVCAAGHARAAAGER